MRTDYFAFVVSAICTLIIATALGIALSKNAHANFQTCVWPNTCVESK